MEVKEKSKDEKNNQTRRKFIKNSGLTVGGLIIGGTIGNLIGRNPNLGTNATPTSVQPHQMNDYSEAMQFFTRKEDFDTLSAAVECIFPEDEHGPGAIGLGVPYFIDKQLASPWGRNADDYMVRPFNNGYSPLTRGDIMIQGVRKLNAVAQKKHKTSFSSLKEDEQIALLQEFESGKVEMQLVSSVQFFALLRQLTIEGCYCDPLHGGNKSMEGWKMKEYPGAYMTYVDVVEEKYFVKKEPKSLSEHM